MKYCRKNQIAAGMVFITRGGLPLDRSNVWREMKKLCETAGIPPEKVFPHNFRHLFARIWYKREKDVVLLSDILGHSSIDTTRIYTQVSIQEHSRKINRLGLILLPDEAAKEKYKRTT